MVQSSPDNPLPIAGTDPAPTTVPDAATAPKPGSTAGRAVREIVETLLVEARRIAAEMGEVGAPEVSVS